MNQRVGHPVTSSIADLTNLDSMEVPGSDALVGTGRMIRAGLGACLFVVLAGPALAARVPTAPGDGPLGGTVLGLIAKDVSTLSIVPVDRDDQELVWAAWTDYGVHDAQAPTSHLALIRKTRTSPILLWSERHPGAYEPRIEPLHGDGPSGVTAVLLRDQLGAAYARAILYTVDRHDAVRRVGTVEGGIIDLLTYADNTLRVGADPHDRPTCYGWRRSDDTLAVRPCP